MTQQDRRLAWGLALLLGSCGALYALLVLPPQAHTSFERGLPPPTPSLPDERFRPAQKLPWP
ncbi:MAG TPA: hypothetical protein VJN18_24900 [Polyangiaceae bacterium]|nr:hypothetical protein [Polyangiaceae bacterium]